MVVPSFRRACYQTWEGGFTERIPYSSPYGSWSFSTPDWYQNMAAQGYSRIGEINAYTGDSYYNYYDSSNDYAGYSYEYSYDW